MANEQGSVQWIIRWACPSDMFLECSTRGKVAASSLEKDVIVGEIPVFL